MLSRKVFSNTFWSVLLIRKELLIVALQSPRRIYFSNIVMKKGYVELSLMSFFRLWSPFGFLFNKDDSCHFKILRDFVSDLALNYAVEKESSFIINEIIEEFLRYEVPSWSFFSKFKIFTERFFNIVDEVFVNIFIVVRSLE
jgi:hypothetical protein